MSVHSVDSFLFLCRRLVILGDPAYQVLDLFPMLELYLETFCLYLHPKMYSFSSFIVCCFTVRYQMQIELTLCEVRDMNLILIFCGGNQILTKSTCLKDSFFLVHVFHTIVKI